MAGTKYFVTGIGRSGTMWLARLLDRAEGHECRHEEADPRCHVTPQPWTPFPLERWEGKESYGEVNGMLRYHLSAQHLGPEMEIPLRAYLRRDPLDIVASWMGQGRRRLTELSATCHEVMWHARNLEEWARMSGSRILMAESLWADKAKVQELVDWLGLSLEVTDDMMAPVNAGRVGWVWTKEALSVAHRAAERVGYDGLRLAGLLNPDMSNPELATPHAHIPRPGTSRRR